MTKLLVSAVLFILIRVSYGACTIDIVDLTSQVQAITGSSTTVNSMDLIDQHSKEPIKRYVQLLKDGSIMILEQKNCSINNLSLMLLLPENYPLKKASNLIEDILNITTVWKKWFHKLDVRDILNREFSSERFLSSMNKSSQFSYSMDDKIKTTNENSEVVLSFVNLKSYFTPYRNIISIYIGVGGI